jgi:hypothetical protein
MKELVKIPVSHFSKEGDSVERVLLIYRDQCEGQAYALQLLKGVARGRLGIYISCFEETEDLRKSLRTLGEWVSKMEEEGVLKIIGSESAEGYLGFLIRKRGNREERGHLRGLSNLSRRRLQRYETI